MLSESLLQCEVVLQSGELVAALLQLYAINDELV